MNSSPFLQIVNGNQANIPLQSKSKHSHSISRFCFPLGVFHVNSYKIRLSFDCIKGFKARVSCSIN